MPTLSKTVSVGTTPVKLLNSSLSRKSWNVTMNPTVISAGNTGIVYVGIGHVPTATTGDPNQGIPLSAGVVTQETKRFENDPISKLEIWAVASTTNQLVQVTETSDGSTT